MVDMQKNIWDLDLIQKMPGIYDAPGFEQECVEPLFYDNMPWHGKPTRVFAWYGCPEGASAEAPVPGMVLVHGGGGTALADWCRHWIREGYAVIAMDNCGGVPGWSDCPWRMSRWPRHEYSGPSGWTCPGDADAPPRDQWLYHAVSSVLRAKKILESKAEVQKDNISVNGISWGAVITSIAIGLDNSFRCAVPVYGCGGFSNPESGLFKENASPELNRLWFGYWDPDHYLKETTVPALFLAGTNDTAFPLGNWDESAKLPQGKVYRSLIPDYPHDHTTSWESVTLNDFVRTMTEGGTLPEFITVSCRGNEVTAEFTPGDRKIKSAHVFYTRASGAWQDRKWTMSDAAVTGNTLTAVIPSLTTTFYVGIKDEKDCLWTSALTEIK